MASRLQCASIVVALTLGVAGISGVDGASRAARAALRADSRQWLAADLSINSKDWLDEQQTTELNRLVQTGIRWTVVTSTLSMAESDQAPDAVFTAVKAVDPSQYPFYGQIELAPTQSLAAALSRDRVVVTEDALERLQVHIGDAIRIGRQQFRIAAAIRAEPDRFAGTQSAGPRCILSREAYDLSGIARGGNTELHRVLLKLPAGTNIAEVRRDLEPIFPDANFIDFRESNQQAVWTVETVIVFLRVTAFLALVTGSIGVALAIRQHVERRLYTAVVMKILGARSRQVGQIFFIQVLWLTLAAIAIGIPLGWMVQTSILSLVARIVPIPFRFRMDGAGAAATVAAGMLAALPAFVQPWFLLRRLKVAAALRRYAEEKWVESERAWGPLAIGLSVGVAGLVVVAGLTLGRWNSAAFLVGGLAACVASVFGLTVITLRLIRRWTTRLSMWGMGIANLHRPGNRSRTLIAGMASGLLLMLATFEASSAVSAAVLDVLPFDRANLFIIGFDDLYAEPLHRFLSSQAGLERPVQMITLSWLRLVSVNGMPIERRPMSATHEIANKWMVSCVEGAQPPGGLAISSDLARLLDARAGTRIDFAGRERIVHTTVSEVRNLTPGEKIWSSFVVNCRDLEGQNLYHHAALRVQSAHLGEVRRMVHARYPTLAVISGPELMVITQVIAKEALVLIRVVAWYAIGAGWSVLFAVIAASRLTRFRELGILAALGAGRRKLIQIYTVEFAAIGFVAGVIGSLVACAFTLLVLAAVFGHAFLAFDWRSIAAAIPLTMAATVLAGWCSTYRLLGRKPIEALRDE